MIHRLLLFVLFALTAAQAHIITYEPIKYDSCSTYQDFACPKMLMNGSLIEHTAITTKIDLASGSYTCEYGSSLVEKQIKTFTNPLCMRKTSTSAIEPSALNIMLKSDEAAKLFTLNVEQSQAALNIDAIVAPYSTVNAWGSQGVVLSQRAQAQQKSANQMRNDITFSRFIVAVITADSEIVTAQSASKINTHKALAFTMTEELEKFAALWLSIFPKLISISIKLLWLALGSAGAWLAITIVSKIRQGTETQELLKQFWKPALAGTIAFLLFAVETSDQKTPFSKIVAYFGGIGDRYATLISHEVFAVFYAQKMASLGVVTREEIQTQQRAASDASFMLAKAHSILQECNTKYDTTRTNWSRTSAADHWDLSLDTLNRIPNGSQADKNYMSLNVCAQAQLTQQQALTTLYSAADTIARVENNNQQELSKKVETLVAKNFDILARNGWMAGILADSTTALFLADLKSTQATQFTDLAETSKIQEKQIAQDIQKNQEHSDKTATISDDDDTTFLASLFSKGVMFALPGASTLYTIINEKLEKTKNLGKKAGSALLGMIPFVGGGLQKGAEIAIEAATSVSVLVASLTFTWYIVTVILTIVSFAIVVIAIMLKIFLWLVDLIKIMIISPFALFFSIALAAKNGDFDVFGKTSKFAMQAVIATLFYPSLIVFSVITLLLSWQLFIVFTDFIQTILFSSNESASALMETSTEKYLISAAIYACIDLFSRLALIYLSLKIILGMPEKILGYFDSKTDNMASDAGAEHTVKQSSALEKRF